MPAHSETRTLPYTPQQMYDLVADVGRYPEFLPWTGAARVRSREPMTGPGGEHGELMHADLVVSFKVFRERFGSRVELWPVEKLIKTDYLDGPFKHLHSEWRFEAADAGCRVHFEVDFEFKNRILQRAAGLFFFEAMQRIVRAFEARAGDLYGAPAAASSSDMA